MIKDTSGNVITVGSVDVISGSSQQILCKIDCSSGKILRATAATDLTIEAKQTDQPDFTDLVSDGLDLSEFDGTTEDFAIRLTADEDLLTIAVRSLRIYVENI